MKTRSVIAGLLGAATVAAAGTVAAATGGTLASYTTTVAGGDTVIRSATVALGRGGPGPDLLYAGLTPGHAQTVDLSVHYVGSIPADLSLAVEPGPAPALCAQSGATWRARPGVAVTVRIGSADPVAYCALLGGARLPLAKGVAPDSTVTAAVSVELSGDAAASALGLTSHDIAVVHADGGFTDKASGHLDLTTAAPAPGAPAASAAPEPLAVAAPGTPATPVDPGAPDPAAAARRAGTPVAVPAACAAAGMKASDFAEVILVDPATRTWDARIQRGAGAGPFLILGTAGNDTIVGSDGADCIVGGAGRDDISGGKGNDVIVGSPASTCHAAPTARVIGCRAAAATTTTTTVAPTPTPTSAPTPTSTPATAASTAAEPVPPPTRTAGPPSAQAVTTTSAPAPPPAAG